MPDKLDCLKQAMELGVRLNLLCSRLDEVAPALQSFLTSFQTALDTASDSMSSFVQALLPALNAATVAHSATAQAERAQVWKDLRDSVGLRCKCDAERIRKQWY